MCAGGGGEGRASVWVRGGAGGLQMSVVCACVYWSPAQREAGRDPGLHDTAVAALACPLIADTLSPDQASHVMTVLSAPHDASRPPSGLHATPNTAPACPSSCATLAPLVGSHTTAVLSSDPEASLSPDGFQATLLT